MTSVYGANTVTNENNNVITNNGKNGLGKDEFLKLLTAQLKNQDPMSPMENADFVAQLAQFSSLEQMSNIADSIDELKQSMTSLFSQSLLTQGAAMIGKKVSGTDAEGNAVSGIIESVKWSDGNLLLKIEDKVLSMDQIAEIREPVEEVPEDGVDEVPAERAEGTTEAVPGEINEGQALEEPAPQEEGAEVEASMEAEQSLQ